MCHLEYLSLHFQDFILAGEDYKQLVHLAHLTHLKLYNSTGPTSSDTPDIYGPLHSWPSSHDWKGTPNPPKRPYIAV